MKVKVYFRDGHKAVFEADRVVFMRADNTVFTATESIAVGRNIPWVISDGIAVVNWASVCFVRRIEEEEDLLDDE